jgi:sterol desaturase/sphingolipid hydroxylase (fatty acid hydroxylase superfamily)
MGLVAGSALLALIAVAYSYRASTLLGIDLWAAIIVQTPESLADILTRNFGIYLILYCSSYFILYVQPFRSIFFKYKLNKTYPSTSLVAKEFLRSCRGVLIASLQEYAIHHWNRSSTVPLLSPHWLHVSNAREDASPVPLLLALVLGYAYGDFHFYWTHRLLHQKKYYAMIHKYHHESFNPDPFSGLSMHPIESAVYFSSAFSLAFFVPLWMGRLLFIGLIIFPLEGHSGYGSWNHEESVNHYIHHSKFEWNYGSSPLWDRLMGTDYKMQPDATVKSSQFQEAEASAKLAGGIIGNSLTDITTHLQ